MCRDAPLSLSCAFQEGTVQVNHLKCAVEALHRRRDQTREEHPLEELFEPERSRVISSRSLRCSASTSSACSLNQLAYPCAAVTNVFGSSRRVFLLAARSRVHHSSRSFLCFAFSSFRSNIIFLLDFV